MKLRSIRWRLPMTYALIALLATLLLGVVLLTTLHGYYAGRELAYLNRSAFAVSQLARDMLRNDMPQAAIQAQFEGLSFVSQTRVRLFDANRNVLADSGVPENREFMISSVPIREPIEGAAARWPFPGNYTSMIFVRRAAPDIPNFEAEITAASGAESVPGGVTS